MRYSSFRHNIRNGVHAILPLILIILLSSFASFAFTPQPNNSDEIKKMIKKASKLTRAGSFLEAEEILRRVVAMDGTRSDARVELAFVLTKQRILLEAYELSYAVAKAEPKNSRAFSVLGATMLTAGRFPEARMMFLAAVKLNRTEHLAWAGFGMLDFYENNIDESIQNLREAVFYEPSEPDYIFALAQVSARFERYKEAADAYQTFLDISSITDVDRRARIKGLISFLKYLGNANSLYRVSGKDKTVVPFELVGNRPVINLRINGGREPLRFVLDTGSGISVLSDETAKRLNIKAVARGGSARGIGGNGKFDIVYGFVREISIGDVTIKNVPVYVRQFQKENHKVDGYIGLSLISKFLTTIDYGSETFSLTKKTSEPTVPMEKNDLSLPLRLTSSGFLSGQVHLQGIEAPLNFIVDTGASVSVISQDVAKNSVMTPFLNEEKIRVIGSAGVTENVSSFMLPRVSFGKNTRTDIMAVALDLDIINEASGFEQAGILGGNFLKNYRLTFDFKNSVVTFVSVKPDKE